MVERQGIGNAAGAIRISLNTQQTEQSREYAQARALSSVPWTTMSSTHPTLPCRRLAAHPNHRTRPHPNSKRPRRLRKSGSVTFAGQSYCHLCSPGDSRIPAGVVFCGVAVKKAPAVSGARVGIVAVTAFPVVQVLRHPDIPIIYPRRPLARLTLSMPPINRIAPPRNSRR